jgi:hypothetical protein
MSATLAGFDLTMDLEEFLEAQGEALRRPAMQEAAQKGMAAAAGLISPALVYDWFAVGERDRKKAEVGDVVFALGRHADLLEPARMAFVAVVTIGPGLEAHSRELQASGKALDSFMLDAAGVHGVGKLIGMAHSIVEQDAAERGWGVGAELAPGQLSGWAIAEQILVGRLLDLESIGVRVTESGMLVPQKSASLMVGIGPDYESSEVRSPCEYCELGETCRYRH